jgi:hypothetical protein
MGSPALNRRLRSRLLVGVATVALATPLGGHAKAQEAKWQPWLEAGGAIGSHSFGDVDMFIPVWQDQTSLLFGDLRGTFTAQPTQEGNFGLGYRTQVDSDWILGGYGFIDIQNSKYDNLFYQGSVGLEALSVDWDLRLNGYVPFNGGPKDVPGDGGTLQISGHDIGITHEEERALFGFDGEVGWRLPLFPADGDLDLRAFLGGYWFAASDVDTVAGPRGRIELRLYDLELLGLQSRLTLDGEIQWDSPRGTQGFGGLELRIPLGMVAGATGPRLSALDRRMADRVERDLDIVTRTFESKPQDVVVDELTVPTHTIVFAAAGGTGDGTKGNPADLETAVNMFPGRNAIIVVDGSDGPVPAGTDFGQTLQLLPGQALLGGGSSVPLHEAGGHGTVGFHVPGERPILVGNDPSADLVGMASGAQNEIVGFDLGGSMRTGIAGTNMERAIVKDTAIDAPASDGILLVDQPGGIPLSQVAHLEGNEVAGAGAFGIAEVSVLYDGQAHSQAVVIDGNRVSGALSGGILLETRASDVPSLQRQVLIAGNRVSGVGGNGITVFEQTQTVAGAILSGLSVYGNAVTNAGSDGILIFRGALAAASVSQALAAGRNEITSVGGTGLFVNDTVLQVPGAVESRLAVYGNSVSLAGVDGIGVAFFGMSLGSLSQSLALGRNSIAAASSDGLLLLQAVNMAGALTQNVAIYGNAISAAGDRGLLVTLQDLTLGPATRTIEILSNSVSAAGRDGIAVEDVLFDAGAVSRQIAIDANTVQAVGSNGISLLDEVVDAAGAALDTRIGGNAVSAAGAYGIRLLETAASVTGAATAALSIYANSVSVAGKTGIVAGFTGGSLGSLSRSARVDGNTVATAGGNGIGFTDSIGPIGGAVVQDLSIGGNDIRAVADNGIAATLVDAGIGGDLSQSIAVSANRVADAGSGGIVIAGTLATLGIVSQTLSIDGNSLTDLGGSGLYLRQQVQSAAVGQALAVRDNRISDVGGQGILDLLLVAAAGSMTQAGTIDGNQVTGAASNGLLVGASAAIPLVIDISLSGNTLSGNGRNGFAGRADGAGVSETFTLVSASGNHFTGNAGAGAYLSDNGGAQALHINGNDLSGNAGGATAAVGPATITP